MRNAVLILISLALAPFCPARTITVDDDGPADFNNIQAAIEDSNDGDTITVGDGTYTGDGNRDIDFKGKTITLRSENGPENCIIDCNGREADAHRGLHFRNGEGPDSVLSGFTVTNGYAPDVYGGGGILCYSSSPTITNCIIRDNVAPVVCEDGGIGIGPICGFISGGGIHCIESDARISNCRIWGNRASGSGGGLSFSYSSNPVVDNCLITSNRASNEFDPSIGRGGGIYSFLSNPMIRNCTVRGNYAAASGGGFCCDYNGCGALKNSILWGNKPDEVTGGPLIVYSNIQHGWLGEGNIDEDPCFADPGFWDPNGTPGDASDDFFVDGDYHLKSQAGRWDPNSKSWVADDVTSPCIDAGEPMSPVGYEPFPNGGIINMGAYGGTPEASKSYFGEPVCEVIVVGDINGDCIVDFRDFFFIGLHWMEDNN